MKSRRRALAGFLVDAVAVRTFVAAQYAACDRSVKALGSSLHAPFMTLSFMALPLIPALKLTDKGLFDVGAIALLQGADRPPAAQG